MESTDQPPGTARQHWAFKWGLAIVLLAGVLYVLSSNRESIRRLKDFEIIFILPLAFATTLKYGVAGKIHSDLLKEQGVHLNWRQWYSLSVSSAFYNLFLPAKGGTVLRAIYLKKLYGLDVSAFVNVVIQKSFHVAVFTSAWGAVLIWFSSGLTWGEKARYFLIGTLFALVLAVISFSARFSNRLLGRIAGGKFVFKLHVNQKVFWQLCFSTFFLLTLSGLEYYFSFRAVHIETRVLDCVIAGAVISLSGQLSVTPGNLGIRELFAGFALKIMGYSLADALLVSLVSRAVTIIDTLLLGTLANVYLAQFDQRVVPFGQELRKDENK